MSNVTGQIGNDQVILDNAATEATLRLILQATLATTKAQKEAISGLAKNSGLDPSKVAAVHTQMNALGEAAVYTGAVLGGLTAAGETFTRGINNASRVLGVLTSGEGSISAVTKLFEGLPFGIGAVATGFTKLAEFQEKTFSTYQQLTNSGINFNGSLTDMRMAAANTYMTLDQFGNLLKSNSETFARLGGTANDGAMAFVKMSNQLLKSGAGDNLRALGYTTEEVNQGLASYLQMTGARNKQEMQNTTQITEAAAGYMEQLNGLAELTGKSRKEQEDQLKQASLNAAWQSKLAKMSPEEKEKAIAGLNYALATGGKDAVEAFQAHAMKVPPLTKGAQAYTAMYSDAAAGLNKSADMIYDKTKTKDDLENQYIENRKAQIADGQKYSDQLNYALIAQGGAMGDLQQTVGDLNNTAKTQSDDDVRRALAKKDMDGKQAEAAEKAQAAIQQMGQDMWEKLLPVIAKLLPIVNSMVTGFVSLVEWISKFPKLLETLVIGFGGLIVVTKVLNAIEAARSLIGGGGRGGGIAGAVEGAVGGGPKGGGGIGGVIGGVAEGAGKIGPALSSIGKGAGGLIQGFLEGLAAGLTAFADPVILLGAGVFAGTIAIISAGIGASAIIIGESLPFLAKGLQSFEKVDGKNLISVGEGLGALALGFAAFGAGAVMGSIGGLIGNMVDGIGTLFGGKTPIEKMIDFGKMPIDAKKVKENAEAFVAFSNAMASYKGGPTNDMIGHISNAVTRWFGAKVPVDKMVDFNKVNIDAKKVKGNAEAFIAFSQAMAAYKGGPANPGILSAMADSLRAVFHVPLPLDQFKQFAGLDLGPNIGVNAKAFADFATGMAAIGSTSPGVGGAISESMAGFFAKTPIDKFVEFAGLSIDSKNAESNAAAFTAFSNALSGFKGVPAGAGELGKSGWFGNDMLDNLRRFSNLKLGADTQKNADAFTAFSTALGNFKGFSGSADLGGGFFSNDLLDNLQRFSNLKLGADTQKNADALKSIGDGMEQPAKNIATFNSSLSDLLKIDISQIDKLSGSMSKLKDSVQPDQKMDGFQSGIDSSINSFLSSVGLNANPSATTSAATHASNLPPLTHAAQEFAATNKLNAPADPMEILLREVQTLNKNTMDMVRAMRDTSDNTKKTANVLASNGNLFKAV